MVSDDDELMEADQYVDAKKDDFWRNIRAMASAAHKPSRHGVFARDWLPRLPGLFERGDPTTHGHDDAVIVATKARHKRNSKAWHSKNRERKRICQAAWEKANRAKRSQ